MGDMMHTLLADQQSIERRAVPPVNEPATPAGKIIAAAAKAKQTYRCDHPDADTAMVYGVQIGYLHGEVRRLCNELEQHKPQRDTNLLYATLFCDELECDVLVGFEYSAGCESQTSGPPENCYEGDPEELTVCEVWVGGYDIAAVILERAAEQLTEAALDHMHEQQESARAEWAERRSMESDE